MYTLTGVTKNYQNGSHTVSALQGVDLVIEDGEWLAVQGRTGSGKTTLLHILGGLDHPSAGTVHFDGQGLATLPEARLTEFRAAFVGFVFHMDQPFKGQNGVSPDALVQVMARMARRTE